MKKKKHKKVRLSGFIFLLLFLYLIGVCVHYVITLPIKNIKVEGINLLTEAEVIQAIGLEDDLPMIKLNESYLKDKLESLPLVEDVSLKKNLKGQATITIKEAKVLFYYDYENKIVLSNGKLIEDDNRYLGCPTLVNYVPDEIYSTFVKNFAKIDSNIISMISEIKYDPDKYNDIIIDDQRFFLLMNDRNKVYINVVNIEKMNKYQSVVSKTNITGTLYLDSNSKNFVFEVDKGNENELQ